jgi:hypothetical protein
MIVSLLYHVTRHLLSIPGVLLRRETSRDAELLVLRHENTILRRQLGQRLRLSARGPALAQRLSRLILYRSKSHRCTSTHVSVFIDDAADDEYVAARSRPDHKHCSCPATTNAVLRSQITDRSDTRASARKLLRTSVLRPSSRSKVTPFDVQR